MIGLSLLLTDGGKTRQHLRLLDRQGRWLISCDAFFGCFLAPISFFLALDKLSVVNQTLLFSLTLPATAAVALLWLKEKLPDRFWWSLALIIAGFLVGKLLKPMALGSEPMNDQTTGILWALVSVSATALRNSIRRKLTKYPIGKGYRWVYQISRGRLCSQSSPSNNTAPNTFFYLSFWWVFGVIVIYGLTLCLGTEVLRQYVTRHFAVAKVGLVGSATLVVTVLSAAAFLGEPLYPATVASMMLVLAGVSLRFLLPRPQAEEQ